MKKQYKKPLTESVKVKLFNSILQNIDVITNSRDVSDDGEAKRNNYFEDFDTEEDIWSGRQMKDVWER